MATRQLEKDSQCRRPLAVALLVLFFGFVSQPATCQICLADGAAQDSVEGELVIVPSVVQLMPPASELSCISPLTITPVVHSKDAESTLKVLSAAPTTVASIIDLEAPRNTASVAFDAVETPTEITFITDMTDQESCDPKSQFLAAIRMRANQIGSTPSYTVSSFDASSQDSSERLTVMDLQPPSISEVASARSEVLDFLPAITLSEDATGSLEDSPAEPSGIETDPPLHTGVTLNQENLSAPAATLESDDIVIPEQVDVQHVAALQEMMANPLLLEVPTEPVEQPSPIVETIEPETTSKDWVILNPEVDVTIINELRADVLPKQIGEEVSSEGANQVPENLAEKTHGRLEDAQFVGVGARRFATGNLALWAAPKFYHKPLYFEEPNLERYGQHVGGPLFQSTVSAAHFFGRIPLLPYMIGKDSPCSCDYTLGRYRPGNCNPTSIGLPELSYRGLFYQGLFTTGAAFVVP